MHPRMPSVLVRRSVARGPSSIVYRSEQAVRSVTRSCAFHYSPRSLSAGGSLPSSAFPTAGPFPKHTDNMNASTGKPLTSEELFHQLHHRASTEEPLRGERTAVENQRWGPIVNKRMGGSKDAGEVGEAVVRADSSSSPVDAASKLSDSGSPGASSPSGAQKPHRGMTGTTLPEGSSTTVMEPRFSTLHRPFMGTSTRFHNPNLSSRVSITRADIVNLEKEFLSHSPPGRVNDHLCIAMTRVFRWLADRAFRERYIHRATMLKTVSMAAPAAATVAAYLRTMLASRKRLDSAPFVVADAAIHTMGAGIAAEHREGDAGRTSAATDHGAPGTPTSGRNTSKAKPYNSYADELRGLFTQSECHAVHYQILLNMADVSPVERGAVLLLQALQFCVFLPMFLVYPRMGFRLMGYMAEESSVVWTQMVNDIDLGKIAEHHVPELALSFWGLQARFRAQEAPPPAVIPPRPSMAAALVQDAAQDATHEPRSSQQTDSQGDEGTSAPTDKAQKHHTAHTSGRSHRTAGGTSPSLSQWRRAAMDGDRLTLRDVVLLIRSDEMVFRDLNHRTADALDRGPHQPGMLSSFLHKRLSHRGR